MEWPLGRVIEIISGRDGEVRLVKLKTGKGELLRPVQRISLLEMKKSSDSSTLSVPKKTRNNHTEEEAEQISKASITGDSVLRTRSGRPVKFPERYGH